MAKEISQIEKETLLNVLYKEKLPIIFLRNRLEYVLRVEQLVRNRISFSMDSPMPDLRRREKLNLTFEYQGGSIAFVVEISAIRANNIVTTVPKFMYKDLGRVHSRVPTPPDFQAQFRFREERYSLPFARVADYDFGELTGLMEKSNPPDLNRLIAQLEIWNRGGRFELVIFKDAQSVTVEEKPCDETGETGYASDAPGDAPSIPENPPALSNDPSPALDDVPVLSEDLSPALDDRPFATEAPPSALGAPLSALEDIPAATEAPPSALEDPPATDPFPRKRFATDEMLKRYDDMLRRYLESIGIERKYLDKTAVRFVNPNFQGTVVSHVLIPIVFREYVTGYIHLWNRKNRPSPMNDQALETFFHLAKVLAFSLKLNGYFDSGRLDNKPFVGNVVDISISGMLFSCPISELSMALKTGMELSVRLISPKRWIGATVRIVRQYHNETAGFFGCRFLEIAPEDMRFLFEYIYGKPFTE